MTVYVLMSSNSEYVVELVCVHSALNTAEENAERLSAKHPDKYYFVLTEEVIQ